MIGDGFKKREKKTVRILFLIKKKKKKGNSPGDSNMKNKVFKSHVDPSEVSRRGDKIALRT